MKNYFSYRSQTVPEDMKRISSLSPRLREILIQSGYCVKISRDVDDFGLEIYSSDKPSDKSTNGESASNGNFHISNAPLATLWLVHRHYGADTYQLCLQSREMSGLKELVPVVNKIKGKLPDHLRDVIFCFGKERIGIEKLVLNGV